MPLRPFRREQGFLLPPSLDDLVPQDHQCRFVDAVLEGFGEDEWRELGIDLAGEPDGAAAYHPRVLLGVWLYGFMSGTRSTRKLEKACREQLPYAWLTGLQYPDHNTLWRFWKEHRSQMRKLLPFTVRMAVAMNLVDLALQAVDGTKVQASAAKDRTFSRDDLRRLLNRVEEEMDDLERQNGAENEPPEPRLPHELAQKEALAGRAREALERMERDGDERTNLTDRDAVLLKGRAGFVQGYNAQATVSPLVGPHRMQTSGGNPLVVGEAPEGCGRPPVRGMLITACEVTTSPEDQSWLGPMIVAAEANTGYGCAITLADGGYHSGSNLELLKEHGRVVLMPEAGRPKGKKPYDKTFFSYQPAQNTYICPKGQTLKFQGFVHRKGEHEVRKWRADGRVCRGCEAFGKGKCTTSRSGRTVEAGPHEDLLVRHRQLMQTGWARELYKLRKELVEPVFGIIKEPQQARRFLLRGLESVRCEWSLLAATFNLRTLWRVWRRGIVPTLPLHTRHDRSMGKAGHGRTWLATAVNPGNGRTHAARTAIIN